MPRVHPATVLWWIFVFFLIGYVISNPHQSGVFVHNTFTAAITFGQSIATG